MYVYAWYEKWFVWTSGLPKTMSLCIKWSFFISSPFHQKCCHTEWSIWECPNLNHYCRIFHLVSMYLFWVLLISLVRTFWFLKSEFWYSKIYFLAQNGEISKGYPLEILKIIVSNLKNHSRYQNVHTNHE